MLTNNKYLNIMQNKNFLTQTRWLVTIILLLSLGITNAWGTDPTLSDLSFPTENTKLIVDENFNSLSTVSRTSTVAVSTTNQTAYGVFNCIYNNNTNNTYAIENAVNTTKFSTNCLSLSEGSGSPLIAHITTETWGTKGAFRLKTTKTSTEYIGFYEETSGTIYQANKSSIYVRNSAGTISIAKGSGSGASAWNTVGTYTSTDIIDICVIYNNTTSPATYGSSIALGAKTAHFYINGNAVMDGASPQAFALPGYTLTSFRVTPLATSGNKAYVDDVQIWKELPGAAVSTYTVDLKESDVESGIKGKISVWSI